MTFTSETRLLIDPEREKSRTDETRRRPLRPSGRVTTRDVVPNHYGKELGARSTGRKKIQRWLLRQSEKNQR